ncbi:hypothetical protein CXG81DRAFT_29570 [Caulochytrium protostelioides]|uniref:Nicotinamide-nucleotide adenylyltransferase n=1 Tax=Caulochytrium protostelioides TaxID=1555241 RepID=A0A4P9XA31_9FUNG|nr:hypothetical protein CXG81DRAFT_29570 [Caulochytrium protostelioides]|eukprot:RKP02224.1 hypothetical protein CXG81DRAFT_29570 [Caulochytrium protostelioides]
MGHAAEVPLVIVACGSYSPITYLHLRMFEMAKDWVVEDGRFELMGCYFSPVSDAYNKPGLASWHHRVAMCERGVAQSSDIMVDPWEASRKAYQRTTLVLDHFEYEINTVRDGVALAAHKGARESDAPSPRRRVRIMLLAGGDLIQSFAVPNLWAKADLDAILGNFGCIIIERTGSDVHDFLLSNDHLHRHRRHVFVVKQFIHNDISSTKIRLFVQRGMSIKFLLPDQVIDYIEAHALYRK